MPETGEGTGPRLNEDYSLQQGVSIFDDGARDVLVAQGDSPGALEAYRKSLGKSEDILVLSPDSEFFRYMNQSGR